MKIQRGKILGCLLGGAIGDALGWPVEFLLDNEIKHCFGPDGITDLVISKCGKAEITDDTQMTLFTAEGILTAQAGGKKTDIAAYVYDAYLAWLFTQGEYVKKELVQPHWLLDIEGLFAKRAPGLTCLQSLKSGAMGMVSSPINRSKGCGGVMRVAPIGLMFQREEAFQVACDCAAITHGHPSGYLSAGILACMISEIIAGRDIEESVNIALGIAKGYQGHEECVPAVEKAVTLAGESIDSKTAIKRIGEGWVGEEALAIAVFCSLKYRNAFDKAVIAAVNHDGDSDSTGAITGNILGTYLGIDKTPIEWIEQVELAETITRIADDIFTSGKGDRK